MFGKYPISVYFIALSTCGLGMASYVTAGLIPMVSAEFSASTGVAAQLVTAFTLTYGLGSPLIMALLPGHRQRLGLLVALIVFIVANIASALAPTIGWLVGFRGLAGVSAGVVMPLGIAAASALSPPDERGTIISLIMGGMASGTVLGVPLSLFLAEFFGWQAALWLIAIVAGFALTGLLWTLPSLPAAQPATLRQKLSILGDGHIVNILAVSLLAAVASLGMYTFIAPFIGAYTDNAWPSVTLFLWVWGIGGVAGSFLAGPLVDRIGAPWITVGIMLILTVSLSSLAPIALLGPWIIVLPIVAWGAVGWALQVPQNSDLMRIREPHGDGRNAVALNGSALYLGSAIGSAAGGVLIDFNSSISMLAVGSGTIAFIGFLLQLLRIRRYESYGHAQASKPDNVKGKRHA